MAVPNREPVGVTIARLRRLRR